MIVGQETLKRLRSAFNLNIYEVKVWTALLSKGVATAGELSEMTSVPRSRSYDVLESLEKRGFIIMKLGRPIKYLAVPPQEIVKRVQKQLQNKVEQEVEMLEKVRTSDVFEELSLLFKQGIDNVDPNNVAGFFKGRTYAYDHMMNLLTSAEKEVIIATTDKGLIRKVELMKSTFRKLKQANISLKILAPLKEKEAKDAASEISDYAEVKSSPLSSRFCIVDDKNILFMVNDDNEIHPSSDVGIWVQSPFFAETLKTLFFKNWK